MSTENQIHKKFRPERTIYLNEDNIGKSNKEDVLFAVEQLRDRAWLCAYGIDARPFHLCFNDPEMYQEFKKDAQALDIKLIAKVISETDMEKIETTEKKRNDTAIIEPKKTYHDAQGKLRVEK